MIKGKVTVILLSAFMIISTLSFSPITANATGASGWQKIGTAWNYLVDGTKSTGWELISGKWYYLNPNGDLATGGWNLINGKWYYLNRGDMTIGWIKIGGVYGKWYYLNPNGDMATGWKHLGTKWYYLNADGDMAVNTTTIDGYKVDSTGAWISWFKSNGKWYSNNGTLATGWVKEGATWYLLNSNQVAKTGWFNSGNLWYLLNSKGEMQCYIRIKLRIFIKKQLHLKLWKTCK